MDGIHDMGGMDGFGPVPIEENEPVFHAQWHGRVWALNSALGALGHWNIDAGRHTLEKMDPISYLKSSYYFRWLCRTENLLVAHGMVTREELIEATVSKVDSSTKNQQSPLSAQEILLRQERSRSARVNEIIKAQFAAGDQVRTRNIHPEGHTRIPRYVRHKIGIINRDYGVFNFPDSNANFAGKKPQHLYSVSFSSQEIWGGDAKATDKVFVDVWDDYLEAL